MFYAHLLNICTPRFRESEEQLMEYYEQQQYHLLFRYLQRPFQGEILDACYRSPIDHVSKKRSSLKILDFGCGVPYATLHALRKGEIVVDHVDLVDLDLASLDFAEFAVNEVADEDTSIEVHPLQSPSSLPTIHSSPNVAFGKDVFEHHPEPDRALREITDSMAPDSNCIFDLRDHGGVRFQHINPDLTGYTELVKKAGYEVVGTQAGMTIFERCA